jgi:hypothetical protein
MICFYCDTRARVQYVLYGTVVPHRVSNYCCMIHRGSRKKGAGAMRRDENRARQDRRTAHFLFSFAAQQIEDASSEYEVVDGC